MVPSAMQAVVSSEGQPVSVKIVDSGDGIELFNEGRHLSAHITQMKLYFHNVRVFPMARNFRQLYSVIQTVNHPQ